MIEKLGVVDIKVSKIEHKTYLLLCLETNHLLNLFDHPCFINFKKGNLKATTLSNDQEAHLHPKRDHLGSTKNLQLLEGVLHGSTF